MKKIVNWLISHPLYIKHREAVKFVLVGVTNTVVDFLLYGLLANIVGLHPVAANLISVGICMCMSFVLNMKFVWKSKKSIKQTAPRFFVVTVFTGWGVQGAVIWLVTGLLGGALGFMGVALLNLFAKLCAGGIGMFVNFIGYRTIFRERGDKQREEKSA